MKRIIFLLFLALAFAALPLLAPAQTRLKPPPVEIIGRKPSIDADSTNPNFEWLEWGWDADTLAAFYFKSKARGTGTVRHFGFWDTREGSGWLGFLRRELWIYSRVADNWGLPPVLAEYGITQEVTGEDARPAEAALRLMREYGPDPAALMNKVADALRKGYRKEHRRRLPEAEPRRWQAVLVVREREAREAVFLKWGLVPRWARDPGIGNKLINARAETVTEKPSFRDAFSRRRCLVPMEGFYEWARRGDSKRPFYFHMKDGEPFAVAGLWEAWEGDGGVLETCTLLTTEANGLLSRYHDRMPVILTPEHYDLWPDSNVRSNERLLPLLRPYAPEEMTAYAVSTLVNSPSTDSPRCVAPVSG